MRWLLLGLAAMAPAWGCGCFNSATPCTEPGRDTVIFVGRVLVDSGEKWGVGPARVLVEEPLDNAPGRGAEVEIDSQAGTSCHYRYREGERYVVFARWSEKKKGTLVDGACTTTFMVRGNEHLVEALRNRARGGAARLVGTVRRSRARYDLPATPVAGARVVARSGARSYEAVSDGEGRYEMHGVEPGAYDMEVSAQGFVADEEYNRQLTALGAGGVAHYSVDISRGGCGMRNLRLWPRGRIAGEVTGADGGPVEGVKVGAYALDRKGGQESSALREAVTDGAGRYLIEPLPGGEYFVGVNAAPYRDEDAYPPALHGSKVVVRDGELTAAIDVKLAARRKEAELVVEVRMEDGTPARGARFSLEDEAGRQRYYSREGSDAAGLLRAKLYQGGEYVVKSFCYRDRAGRSQSFGGEVRVAIDGPRVKAVVVLQRRD